MLWRTLFLGLSAIVAICHADDAVPPGVHVREAPLPSGPAGTAAAPTETTIGSGGANSLTTQTTLVASALPELPGAGALLAASIKLVQEAACETEDLHIQCPANTAIDIRFANYGRLMSSHARPCHTSTGAASNRTSFTSFNGPYDIEAEARDCAASGSKERVKALCQDQRSCLIPVNVETFRRDPCPSTSKYLELAYKCKPNVFHVKVVCEGRQMSLECATLTHRIVIQSAMFGRDRSLGSLPVCPNNSTGAYNASFECRALFATEMAMTKCQGQRTCSLPAGEATFGSECPTGVRQYLSVLYACVPDTLLRSSSDKVGKESIRLEETDY